MTKWMRVLALIAVLSLVAAACGDDDGDGGSGGDGGASTSDDPDDATITEVGAGEGEVNIIAWAGYIEDGSTDENYDWVTSFEEETGCEVNVTTAGTTRWSP
jgi:putative spermidine/putrescine transport system substrate-binding protein